MKMDKKWIPCVAMAERKKLPPITFMNYVSLSYISFFCLVSQNSFLCFAVVNLDWCVIGAGKRIQVTEPRGKWGLQAC